MSNLVLTILLFVAFPSSLFAREWSFVADMNYDYSVTISDLWLWFKWLYFYPGDFILSKIIHTVFGRFFELTEYSYGGYFSGIVSAIIWLIFLVGTYELITETISSIPDNYKKAVNYLVHETHYLTKVKIPLRHILYCLLGILIAFCLDSTLGITLLLLLVLNRWLYLRYYLDNGGNFKKDIALHFKSFKISSKNCFLWLLIPLTTILIISLLAAIISLF